MSLATWEEVEENRRKAEAALKVEQELSPVEAAQRKLESTAGELQRLNVQLERAREIVVEMEAATAVATRAHDDAAAELAALMPDPKPEAPEGGVGGDGEDSSADAPEGEDNDEPVASGGEMPPAPVEPVAPAPVEPKPARRNSAAK